MKRAIGLWILAIVLLVGAVSGDELTETQSGKYKEISDGTHTTQIPQTILNNLRNEFPDAKPTDIYPMGMGSDTSYVVTFNLQPGSTPNEVGVPSERKITVPSFPTGQYREENSGRVYGTVRTYRFSEDANSHIWNQYDNNQYQASTYGGVLSDGTVLTDSNYPRDSNGNPLSTSAIKSIDSTVIHVQDHLITEGRASDITYFEGQRWNGDRSQAVQRAHQAEEQITALVAETNAAKAVYEANPTQANLDAWRNKAKVAADKALEIFENGDANFITDDTAEMLVQADKANVEAQTDPAAKEAAEAELVQSQEQQQHMDEISGKDVDLIQGFTPTEDPAEIAVPKLETQNPSCEEGGQCQLYAGGPMITFEDAQKYCKDTQCTPDENGMVEVKTGVYLDTTSGFIVDSTTKTATRFGDDGSFMSFDRIPSGDVVDIHFRSGVDGHIYSDTLSSVESEIILNLDPANVERIGTYRIGTQSRKIDLKNPIENERGDFFNSMEIGKVCESPCKYTTTYQADNPVEGAEKITISEDIRIVGDDGTKLDYTIDYKIDDGISVPDKVYVGDQSVDAEDWEKMTKDDNTHEFLSEVTTAQLELVLENLDIDNWGDESGLSVSQAEGTETAAYITVDGKSALLYRDGRVVINDDFDDSNVVIYYTEDVYEKPQGNAQNGYKDKDGRPVNEEGYLIIDEKVTTERGNLDKTAEAGDTIIKEDGKIYGTDAKGNYFYCDEGDCQKKDRKGIPENKDQCGNSDACKYAYDNRDFQRRGIDSIGGRWTQHMQRALLDMNAIIDEWTQTALTGATVFNRLGKMSGLWGEQTDLWGIQSWMDDAIFEEISPWGFDMTGQAVSKACMENLYSKQTTQGSVAFTHSSDPSIGVDARRGGRLVLEDNYGNIVESAYIVAERSEPIAIPGEPTQYFVKMSWMLAGINNDVKFKIRFKYGSQSKMVVDDWYTVKKGETVRKVGSEAIMGYTANRYDYACFVFQNPDDRRIYSFDAEHEAGDESCVPFVETNRGYDNFQFQNYEPPGIGVTGPSDPSDGSDDAGTGEGDDSSEGEEGNNWNQGVNI